MDTGSQWFSLSGEVVNVKEFGAKGDGTTDDTAAFQAAHDALGNDGGIIFIPPTGTYYKISAQVSFTKHVTLLGTGWYASELLTDTASLTMFTTAAKLVIQNVGFTASGAAAGTAVAVKTLSTASNHADTMLENNYFQGFARAYWSQRTTSVHVKDNRFAPGGSGRYGLYLENMTSPDEGDSFIHNNYFAGGTGETSIFVVSTSGINISGNKFNGAVSVHLDVAPTTNAVGNFLISNNSFEGMGASAFAIRLIATTGSITKTVINGNQFSGASATHIVVGNNAKNTVITGNSFNDTNAANGIAVDIQANSRNTVITGNAFHQILTAIKSSSGITGQAIFGNKFASKFESIGVTNFYLDGENDSNLSGPGSEKEFVMEKVIQNTSSSTFINAFQLKGDYVLEVFATGIVQGAGSASKYRKVLVTDDTTVTNLIAEVAVGAVFDLQITASGTVTVVGIKRNGATGTSADMNVSVKVTGYVRDFSAI